MLHVYIYIPFSEQLKFRTCPIVTEKNVKIFLVKEGFFLENNNFNISSMQSAQHLRNGTIIYKWRGGGGRRVDQLGPYNTTP